jgi:transposase-like protein
MTVAEVAARLGVTRSTVYAHWREWGGYKLGSGEKALIRFGASKLPSHMSENDDGAENQGPRTTRRRRSRKRALIVDAPRMVEPLEEIVQLHGQAARDPDRSEPPQGWQHHLRQGHAAECRARSSSCSS